MHGNVSEWVEDCWHDEYTATAPTDGSPWLEAQLRWSRNAGWIVGRLSRRTSIGRPHRGIQGQLVLCRRPPHRERSLTDEPFCAGGLPLLRGAALSCHGRPRSANCESTAVRSKQDVSLRFFDLPVLRIISLVPTPSALNRTISARQTCLCGALRSRASTFRRRRSAGLRVMEIPVRMRQTHATSPPGIPSGDSNVRRNPLEASGWVLALFDDGAKVTVSVALRL